MVNLYLDKMDEITYGRWGVGKTAFASEYSSNRSYDKVFWYSTENDPQHAIPDLLSPEDLIQHLDNEEQDRQQRAPLVNWSVLIKIHGNSSSGDHLDSIGLRTLTDAAFQRYLENVKASSGSKHLHGSNVSKGIVKGIFGFGESLYLEEHIQSSARTRQLPAAGTDYDWPDFGLWRLYRNLSVSRPGSIMRFLDLPWCAKIVLGSKPTTPKSNSVGITKIPADSPLKLVLARQSPSNLAIPSTTSSQRSKTICNCGLGITQACCTPG